MMATSSPRSSVRSRRPRWPYVLLFVFVVLHNDLWWWDDPSFVLGLPVTLTYHLGYCLAAMGLMALLLRYAWPHDLESDDSDDTSEAGQ